MKEQKLDGVEEAKWPDWKAAAEVARREQDLMVSNYRYMIGEIPTLNVPEEMGRNLISFFGYMEGCGNAVVTRLGLCASEPDNAANGESYKSDVAISAVRQLADRIREMDNIVGLLYDRGRAMGGDMGLLYLLVAESAVNILGAYSRMCLAMNQAVALAADLCDASAVTAAEPDQEGAR